MVEPVKPDRDAALVIVDVQNDFCPGGKLAVAEGDRIVPLINQLQAHFKCVVATQDWHPANHVSFVENDPAGIWPEHCVQGSFGAEFVAELDTARLTKVIRKGTDCLVDSYSGFFDNDHQTSTGLGDFLREAGIREIYVVGLATDYCVKFTALDALADRFTVTLVVDAARGVELKEGDVQRAIQEMQEAGVRVITSDAILN